MKQTYVSRHKLPIYIRHYICRTYAHYTFVLFNLVLFINSFVYKLDPWTRRSREATSSSDDQKLAHSRVHFRICKACDWTLYLATCIQSIFLSHIPLRPILMLSSHLRLDLPNGLCSSAIPTETVYAFRISLCMLHVPTISSSLI
jgi:hypothetical protein